jgi:predicted GH43/DUF377 family glycosyl hydrolase
MPIWFLLIFSFCTPAQSIGVSSLTGAGIADTAQWNLGPFIRPAGNNPIIRPEPFATFYCPMSKNLVQWQSMHTFNPAAVVVKDTVFLLYRAEDSSGTMKIGGHTSRLGLATSTDGIHFKQEQQPVLYPANDKQKRHEWKGGCEDPRLVRTADGTFILTYTQYNRIMPRMAVATSKDLRHWTKHGPAFKGFPGWMNWPTKSGAIVCEVIDGELRAAKTKGKYWMYMGERKLFLADSRDGMHWHPRKVVYRPRPGKYDSQLTEAGPPAVITDKGVVLLYNGKNASKNGDTSLPSEVYTVGQLLFDKNDFYRLKSATLKPCFMPEAAFEKTGQYGAGTTFAEGLVLFKGKWFLYYGCADSFVGVAVSTP